MFGCTAYSGQTPKLNSVVPGKSPQYIAKAAGFEVPADATILAAECKEVGENEPLTMEKLAPVQAVLKSDNKEQGFEMCEAMLKHGAGHTAAIHTNDRDLVREYGQRMHACRIIWNSPSSLGGVGDIYNAIAPSLTLGCGSYGGNSVSGNVQAVNLHQHQAHCSEEQQHAVVQDSGQDLLRAERHQVPARHVRHRKGRHRVR